jgi:hypothetical protein
MPLVNQYRLRQILRLVAGSVLLLAFSLWGFAISRRWHLCNSISDAVWLSVYFFEDSTTYAQGYSEKAFVSIARGDSKEKVLALLGDPLSKETTARSEEIWRYAAGAPDKNYWFRIVVFDSGGQVLASERKYFVD